MKTTMKKVSAEDKKAMKELGVWEEFLVKRDKLKANGASASRARLETLEIYRDKIEAFLKGGNGAVEAGTGKKVNVSFSSFFDKMSKGEYDKFMKLEMDIADVVQWVAKRLDVPLSLIKKEKIPCAEALSMLLVYNTRLGRNEFWSNMYVKFAKGADHSANRSDGATIIETTTRILRMTERAEAK